MGRAAGQGGGIPGVVTTRKKSHGETTPPAEGAFSPGLSMLVPVVFQVGQTATGAPLWLQDYTPADSAGPAVIRATADRSSALSFQSSYTAARAFRAWTALHRSARCPVWLTCWKPFPALSRGGAGEVEVYGNTSTLVCDRVPDVPEMTTRRGG